MCQECNVNLESVFITQVCKLQKVLSIVELMLNTGVKLLLTDVVIEILEKLSIVDVSAIMLILILGNYLRDIREESGKFFFNDQTHMTILLTHKAK